MPSKTNPTPARYRMRRRSSRRASGGDRRGMLRSESGHAPVPRAVVLVANTAAPYSRGLRVARALSDVGYEVELAASTVGDTGQGWYGTDREPPREDLDGEVVIRRYEPSGFWSRWSNPGLAVDTGLIARLHRALGRIVPPLARIPALTGPRVLSVLFWPFNPLGWSRTLRKELAPADLYHACGIRPLPAALGLARAARKHGRVGRVIYDVIDINLESNNYWSLPGFVLSSFKRRERRWVKRVNGVVTVNGAIAAYIQRSWGLAERPTVLPNYVSREHAVTARSELIRRRIGIPAERKIVLFLGRIGPNRGLEETAEAVLSLDNAALVVIGFGPWADRFQRLGVSTHEGRVFVLPPVHPDEVPAWASAADVSVIPAPSVSINQRLASPNKLWESIMGGTPVVVGEDLEAIRDVVTAEGIGVLADPLDPTSLSRALGSILDQSAEVSSRMRARCLDAALIRYNWETGSTDYRSLVAAMGSVASR